MITKTFNPCVVNTDTPFTVDIYETDSSDLSSHWLRIPQTSDGV